MRANAVDETVADIKIQPSICAHNPPIPKTAPAPEPSLPPLFATVPPECALRRRLRYARVLHQERFPPDSGPGGAEIRSHARGKPVSLPQSAPTMKKRCS